VVVKEAHLWDRVVLMTHCDLFEVFLVVGRLASQHHYKAFVVQKVPGQM
jgi:hypothetical protein